jgi:hypothetical protein
MVGFLCNYSSNELSQLNCIEPWKDSLLYKGTDEWAISLERLGSLQATDHTKAWHTLSHCKELFIPRSYFQIVLAASCLCQYSIETNLSLLIRSILRANALKYSTFFGSLIYHCVNHHGWIFMFFLSSLHLILLWIVLFLIIHGSYLNWRYIAAVFTGTWISTTHSDGDSTKSATKYWKEKIAYIMPIS